MKKAQSTPAAALHRTVPRLGLSDDVEVPLAALAALLDMCAAGTAAGWSDGTPEKALRVLADMAQDILQDLQKLMGDDLEGEQDEDA